MSTVGDPAIVGALAGAAVPTQTKLPIGNIKSAAINNNSTHVSGGPLSYPEMVTATEVTTGFNQQVSGTGHESDTSPIATIVETSLELYTTGQTAFVSNDYLSLTTEAAINMTGILVICYVSRNNGCAIAK